MRLMTKSVFHCSAGLNFAVVNDVGDIFLCTNFMYEPNQKKIGNIYKNVEFSGKFYPCKEAFCICPQHKHDPELFESALKLGTSLNNQLPYDIWLHWLVTSECFFSCDYCEAGNNLFNKQIIKPIDVQSLMKTLDNTGKIFRLSFTGGGEPMAVPNILEACSEITTKHYISFNTNLVGVEMSRFISSIDCSKVIAIQASAHLKELERTNNFDRFFRNYHAWKQANVPIYVNVVGIPSLFPEVKKFKELFAKNEVSFTFAPYSGNYQGKQYPHAYTDEELTIMEMDITEAQIHEIKSEPGRNFPIIQKATSLFRSFTNIIK